LSSGSIARCDRAELVEAIGKGLGAGREASPDRAPRCAVTRWPVTGDGKIGRT
jgi:hypothetical protein